MESRWRSANARTAFNQHTNNGLWSGLMAVYYVAMSPKRDIFSKVIIFACRVMLIFVISILTKCFPTGCSCMEFNYEHMEIDATGIFYFYFIKYAVDYIGLFDVQLILTHSWAKISSHLCFLCLICEQIAAFQREHIGFQINIDTYNLHSWLVFCATGFFDKTLPPGVVFGRTCIIITPKVQAEASFRAIF